MGRRIFVTGIGTDVGKTVASAILCEALRADYWKPIQAGSLECTDSDTVRSLISNSETKFHAEAYRLIEARSPHAAAESEGVTISLKNIIVPETDRDLIIEGAGGVMVPLAKGVLVRDLIAKVNGEVVVVSRNYLGSINHTLLTLEALSNASLSVIGILFNGAPTPASESFITQHTNIPILGHIREEERFTPAIVSGYARAIAPNLRKTL